MIEKIKKLINENNYTLIRENLTNIFNNDSREKNIFKTFLSSMLYFAAENNNTVLFYELLKLPTITPSNRNHMAMFCILNYLTHADKNKIVYAYAKECQIILIKYYLDNHLEIPKEINIDNDLILHSSSLYDDGNPSLLWLMSKHIKNYHKEYISDELNKAPSRVKTLVNLASQHTR